MQSGYFKQMHFSLQHLSDNSQGFGAAVWKKKK